MPARQHSRVPLFAHTNYTFGSILQHKLVISHTYSRARRICEEKKQLKSIGLQRFGLTSPVYTKKIFHTLEVSVKTLSCTR
jgi:hypothetical protein